MTLLRRPTPARVAPSRVAQGASQREASGEWFALSAPAKVNLFLEVLGRREDGFHELETVMAPLRLADRLWMRSTPTPGETLLKVFGPMASGTPTDASNLVVRGLNLLRQHAGVELGAEVVLEKNIPSEAGLGGGSSDAAAALVLVNRVWSLGLDADELHQVAAALGSDVPFFLSGRPALCRGRGEKVTPLTAPAGQPCVVVKPPVGLSTAAVYAELASAGGYPANAQSSSLVKMLSSGDWPGVARALFNRLQAPAFRLEYGLSRVAAALENAAPLGAMMTGSGSAFFAVTANHRAARRLTAQIRAEGYGWAHATLTA